MHLNMSLTETREAFKHFNQEIIPSNELYERLSENVVIMKYMYMYMTLYIVTYLVSSRRFIEIWRVCKMYGRRGEAEPSIYLINPPYFIFIQTVWN